MTCDLLDLPCHAITGAFGLWDSIGWGWQLMIVIGFGLVVLGAVWNFGRIVKAIAGWPGVAGLGIIAVAIGGAVLTGLRRIGKPNDEFTGGTPDPDPKPTRAPRPTIFRRTAKRTPGKRPTIFDR